MGAKPSTLTSSTRDSTLSSYDDHDTFIELLKPDCMKPKKRRRKEKKTVNFGLKRRFTLEDWIMASPSTEPASFYGGELYVFKQYKKVHPQPYYSSSSSPSFDRLRDKVMVNSSSKRNDNKKDDGDYGEEGFSSIAVVSSFSTISGNEKSKKKVSFRSPDESDIIFFYSPKDRF